MCVKIILKLLIYWSGLGRPQSSFIFSIIISSINKVNFCILCCRISLYLLKDSSLVVITWQLFHLSGVIFGFSVKANESIKKLADKKGIKIKLHNIIYKLIEDLKDELNSRMPPTVVETTVGEFSLIHFCLKMWLILYSPVSTFLS